MITPGDLALTVGGETLVVPAADLAAARQAVEGAAAAFAGMGLVSDQSISNFFEEFACRLEDETIWGQVLTANQEDVAAARSRGRSTTRLEATAKMRVEMVQGLREWRDAPSRRNQVLETVQHDGWMVQQITAPLGVVGFVFEGRPNVFADATGVLRGGNTVVFRIGGDALGTARAIMQLALNPALQAAGLPAGAASLVDSAGRAAGWAMFSDTRLALAVARGSGAAVAQLGAIARQHGIPVSLHGTGGAWLVADQTADPQWLSEAVLHSLDRKVCNTLNVCCLPRERADLLEVFLDAARRAGERRQTGFRLHLREQDLAAVPAELRAATVQVQRPAGNQTEPVVTLLETADLGCEWEWENTPEVTLCLVEDTSEAVLLFNRFSPQFVVTLVSTDQDAQTRFFETVNAPFVGNGFTRWVDGLYALQRPELGLSNWQLGRLFARGAILSGDSVYTIRTRVIQQQPDIHR